MWSNRFTEKASSIALISPRLQAFRSHGNGFTPSAVFSTRFLIVLAVLVFVWTSNALIAGGLFSRSISAAISASQEEYGDPVLNSTLGFHKLYALSLPGHEERRRPLVAAANATNLTLTLLDAVYGHEIPDAEKPPRWKTYKEGELGCLLSHRLTWRKMIDENIQSAIIIESDADWDMRIKPSMQGLRNGVKAIMDWPFNNADYPVNPYTSTPSSSPNNNTKPSRKRPSTHSAKKRPTTSSSSSPPQKEHSLHRRRNRKPTTPPSPDSEPPPAPLPLPLSSYFTDIPLTPTPYGPNWDILWLGHCGSSNARSSRTYLYSDASAAPHSHAWAFAGGPDSDVYRPGTSRVVYELGSVACTTAYAVSLSGAKKLDRLFRLTAAPVDLEMANWCINRVDMRCVGVFPQVMSPAGARSVINQGGDGGEEWGEVSGAGAGIQVSARRNAALGLAGDGEEGWVREWEDSEEDWREGRVYGRLGVHD